MIKMKNKGIKQNILCGLNIITNKCYYKVYRLYAPAIKNLENILKEQEIENKKQLKYITECNNPIELIMSEVNFDDYKDIIKSNFHTIKLSDKCELNPASCKNYIEDIVNLFKIVDDKIKICIESRNQYKRVLEQLQLLIHDSKNKSNVFIKFGIDKNNELICSILDYNKIFDKSIYKDLDLYVIYGRKEFNGNYDTKNTFMYIDFQYNESKSKLKIDDFFCSDFRKRCGHGSFALKSLSEAVLKINDKIVEYNNKEQSNIDGYKIGLIKKIYGDIVPGRDLKYDDLVSFYNKNEYLKDGKLQKCFN